MYIDVSFKKVTKVVLVIGLHKRKWNKITETKIDNKSKRDKISFAT